MKQDIEIVNNESKFKYRVSGLLVKENKLLVCRINDNKFYCLPGGHVELLEDSRCAMIREFNEETLIETKIVRLLFMTENFFKSGKYDCHEIGMYYLLDADDVKIKDFNREEKERDGITHLDFKWLELDNLENVKPEFLKNNIDLNATKHLVIKQDKIISEE